MTEIIEGAYFRDLLEPPAALDRSCKGLTADPILARTAKVLADGRTYDRVVLTGMGSSLPALYPLHLKLLAHGFPSLHVETAVWAQR